MIETARSLNPKVDVVVRSHNAEEASLLELSEDDQLRTAE